MLQRTASTLAKYFSSINCLSGSCQVQLALKVSHVLLSLLEVQFWAMIWVGHLTFCFFLQSKVRKCQTVSEYRLTVSLAKGKEYSWVSRPPPISQHVLSISAGRICFRRWFFFTRKKKDQMRLLTAVTCWHSWFSGIRSLTSQSINNCPYTWLKQRHFTIKPFSSNALCKYFRGQIPQGAKMQRWKEYHREKNTKVPEV